MNHKHLSDDISVCGQLSTDDIALVHALGFKSIICNRPDGEAPDQVLFEVIRTVAGRSDIQTAYVPVKASTPTPDELARMDDAVSRLPRPVLAYCSGGRSEAVLGDILAAKDAGDEA